MATIAEPRLPAMFIVPETLPAWRPPISIQKDQEGLSVISAPKIAIASQKTAHNEPQRRKAKPNDCGQTTRNGRLPAPVQLVHKRTGNQIAQRTPEQRYHRIETRFGVVEIKREWPRRPSLPYLKLKRFHLSRPYGLLDPKGPGQLHGESRGLLDESLHDRATQA